MLLVRREVPHARRELPESDDPTMPGPRLLLGKPPEPPPEQLGIAEARPAPELRQQLERRGIETGLHDAAHGFVIRYIDLYDNRAQVDEL